MTSIAASNDFIIHYLRFYTPKRVIAMRGVNKTIYICGGLVKDKGINPR